MTDARIEKLAEQMHIWYLEACQKLHPESFNAKAQKPYAELSEEQKFLDRYIAERALSWGAAPAQGSAETKRPNATDLARRFHTLYEALAPKFGYETRKESAKPWSQVPEQNQRLMEAVCANIIEEYWPALPSVPQASPEPCRTFIEGPEINVCDRCGQGVQNHPEAILGQASAPEGEKR